MSEPNLTADRPIAFFSAEYAIENNLPIYAGGLGVLSGDMVLEAGSEGVPMVAFGTMYVKGFEAAGGDSADRLDPQAAGFELLTGPDGETRTVEVACDNRLILVQAWQKYYGSARLILIDADHPKNQSTDRQITARLYDANFITKFYQEWVYGLATVAFMRALKIDPAVHHVNEGHTAFVIVGLILDHLQRHPDSSLEEAQAAVRAQVVATKHTILPGAGIFVERLIFQSVAGPALKGVEFEDLFRLGTTSGRPEHFSTTKFIMDHSRAANGVSRLHVASEKTAHANSHLITITNGVQRDRWMAHNLKTAKSSDEELWKAHSANRSNLVATVNDTLGSQLNPNALTVVWARRIAAYKRPALLFNNIERLHALVSSQDRPVQFIIAGKANSGDEEGKMLLEEILKHCASPELTGKVVYLPGYSVPTTKQLVAGADIWLNTPIRGQEACGTSGMKASLNGALQVSTDDGWIEEVDEECVGWKLPEDGILTALYDTFEQKVAPLFYRTDDDKIPTAWIGKMRESMELIDKRYTAKRMLHDYMTKLYFPRG